MVHVGRLPRFSLRACVVFGDLPRSLSPMLAEDVSIGDELRDAEDNLIYTVVSTPADDGPMKVYWDAQWTLDGATTQRSTFKVYDIVGMVTPVPPEEPA